MKHIGLDGKWLVFYLNFVCSIGDHLQIQVWVKSQVCSHRLDTPGLLVVLMAVVVVVFVPLINCNYRHYMTRVTSFGTL